MSESSAIQRAELRRSARKAFKDWKKGGSGKSYSQLIHVHFQSPQYAKLSPRAVKLLVDLMAQYRGINNGDLTTAWSVMQRERRGWIIKTRQGSINAPTLWALTFHGIDDCRDKKGERKLDPGVKADSMPLHLWRLPSYDLPARQTGLSIVSKINRLPGYRERLSRLSGKVPTKKAPKWSIFPPTFPGYRVNERAYLSRLSGTFIYIYQGEG
jgi:hypothetical protein